MGTLPYVRARARATLLPYSCAGADFLSVFDKPQCDALAMLFLTLHQQEVVAAEML